MATAPEATVAAKASPLATVRGQPGAARDAHISEHPRPLHLSAAEVEEVAGCQSSNYPLLSQVISAAEQPIPQ